MLRTKLASLVKGEVLLPERIRATAGGIAFLPYPFRFSDTSANNPSIVGSASHCNRSSPLHKGAKGDSALPTLPKPHYPSPRTKLASLVKGEVLSPERIRATTGGIASPPSLAPHQPFQNRTIPRKSPTPLPCLLLPLHRIPPLPKTTINPKRKALKRSPVAKTGNGASVLYISFTLSICPHLQQAQRFRVRDYPSSQAYIRRPKFRLFRRCRQASAYSCYRLPCRLRSACRCLYGR